MVKPSDEIMRIIPVVFIIMSAVFFASCKDEYSVKRFDLGQGRVITITAKRTLESGTNFFYQVNVYDKEIVPQRNICTKSSIQTVEPLFKIIQAKEGNLIGIYTGEIPKQLLIAHDFGENLTWPGEVNGKEGIDREATWKKLLQELQNEHPQVKNLVGGLCYEN